MATEKAQQFFLAWLMVFGALENTTYSQGPRSLDHIKKALKSRQGVGYHPDPNYKLGYSTKPQLKNGRSPSYQGPVKPGGYEPKGGYGKEHMGHPSSKYKGPDPDFEGPRGSSQHYYKKPTPPRPRKPTNYKSNIKRNPLVSGYDRFRKPARKTDSYNSRGSGYQRPDLGKNGYINYKPPPGVGDRLPAPSEKIGKRYHGNGGNYDSHGPDSHYHGNQKESHYHGPGPRDRDYDSKYDRKDHYSKGPEYGPRRTNYESGYKRDKYGPDRRGSNYYGPDFRKGGPRFGSNGGDRDAHYERGPDYGLPGRGSSYGPFGKGPSYGPLERGPSYRPFGGGTSYRPLGRGPSYGHSGREKKYGPPRGGTDYGPNPVKRRPYYGSGRSANGPGYREENYGPPPKSKYPPKRRYPDPDTDHYTEPKPRTPNYKSTPKSYGKDPYGPGPASHEQPDRPYRRGGPHRRTSKIQYNSREEVTKNEYDDKHYDTQNDDNKNEKNNDEQNTNKERRKRSPHQLNDPQHHSKKNFYKNHGYHKNHGYYYDSNHEKSKKHYGHKYDAMKFGSFGWWKKEKENGKIKHDHNIGDDYWYGKFGKHFQEGKHHYVGKPHLG